MVTGVVGDSHSIGINRGQRITDGGGRWVGDHDGPVVIGLNDEAGLANPGDANALSDGGKGGKSKQGDLFHLGLLGEIITIAASRKL